MEWLQFYLESEGILYTKGFSLKKYYTAMGIKRLSELRVTDPSAPERPSVALDLQLGGIKVEPDQIAVGDCLIASKAASDTASTVHLFLAADRVLQGASEQRLDQLRSGSHRLALFRVSALKEKPPSEITAAAEGTAATQGENEMPAFFRLHPATWQGLTKEELGVITRWAGHIQLGSQRDTEGFFRVRLPKSTAAAFAALGVELSLPPAHGKGPDELRWSGRLEYVGHLK